MVEKIAEKFNCLSRVHGAPTLQTDDRRAADSIIANVNVSITFAKNRVAQKKRSWQSVKESKLKEWAREIHWHGYLKVSNSYLSQNATNL